VLLGLSIVRLLTDGKCGCLAKQQQQQGGAHPLAIIALVSGRRRLREKLVQRLVVVVSAGPSNRCYMAPARRKDTPARSNRSPCDSSYSSKHFLHYWWALRAMTASLRR